MGFLGCLGLISVALLADYFLPPTALGSVLATSSQSSLVRNEGFDPYHFGSVLISKNDILDDHVVQLYLARCNELMVSEMTIQTDWKHSADQENTLLDYHYLVLGSELSYVVTLNGTTDESQPALYVFDNIEDHLNFVHFNIIHEPVYTYIPSNGIVNVNLTASKTSYYFIDIYISTVSQSIEYHVNGTILFYDPSQTPKACQIRPEVNTDCSISLGYYKDPSYCILVIVQPSETDSEDAAVILTYSTNTDGIRNPKRLGELFTSLFLIGLLLLIFSVFCCCICCQILLVKTH